MIFFRQHMICESNTESPSHGSSYAGACNVYLVSNGAKVIRLKKRAYQNAA